VSVMNLKKKTLNIQTVVCMFW